MAIPTQFVLFVSPNIFTLQSKYKPRPKLDSFCFKKKAPHSISKMWNAHSCCLFYLFHSLALFPILPCGRTVVAWMRVVKHSWPVLLCVCAFHFLCSRQHSSLPPCFSSLTGSFWQKPRQSGGRRCRCFRHSVRGLGFIPTGQQHQQERHSLPRESLFTALSSRLMGVWRCAEMGVLNNAYVLYIDLRGLWRGLSGVWWRLQSPVPPGVSQLGVPTWRQVHLFGM